MKDDDRCERDAEKICDNCFRCLEPKAGEDYAKIAIAAIYMEDDFFDDSKPHVDETSGYD